MALYISSVSIVFEPKFKTLDSKHSLDVLTIALGASVGMTMSHAIEFIHKHPLVRYHLKNNCILSLTFKYSEL